MSRNGQILAVAVLVGSVSAACAPASVEDKVAALNERVEALEKQVQSLQAGAPSAQLEQQANAAFTEITNLIAMGKADEAKAKLQDSVPQYRSTKLAGSMQTLQRELAAVGKDSPKNWGIEKWFQGQGSIDLSGQAPTVVVFWESWCPHCRREVPKLQEMYSKYKGQGLQLIGLTRVSKMATDESVEDVITQNHVQYPIAKEDGSAAEYFSVSTIPAAAFLKNGKVVWRGHPAYITPALVEGWLSS